MQSGRYRSARVIILLLALHSRPVPGGAVAPPAGPSDNGAKIALQYDARLESHGFHSPVVEARVAGQEAFFLVDTGASVHTLARWFAETAGLELQSTNSTVAGSTNKTSRLQVAHNVILQPSTAGHSLRLDEAIVVDFPPVFLQTRIGGLLSPQLLAPEGTAAVLDMQIPQIDFIPSGGHFDNGGVCINQRSQFRNRLYTFEIKVEGVRADMLVDSGATSTLLSNKSLASKGLVRRSSEVGQVRGVGGPPVTIQKLDEIKIETGGTSFSLPVSVAEISPACDAEGILGMDVLKRCVVQLGANAIKIRCGPKVKKDPAKHE